MASNDIMNSDDCTVYIAPSGTVGTALASSDIVSSIVANFKQSGGEKDTDTAYAFGGASYQIEQNRSEIEVSFDVLWLYGSASTTFDSFQYGTGLTSGTDGSTKCIYLCYSDGTNKYTRAYNNARVTTIEPAHDVGDYLKGSITFKLPPTTSAGYGNLRIKGADKSTITTWTA